MRIAIIGAGTAGPAAALQLARAGACNKIQTYQHLSRRLTPVFQSHHGWLTLPRDGLMGPLCRVWPIKQRMLTALAGVTQGLLTADPARQLALERGRPQD